MIDERSFGVLADGRDVKLFTLTNSKGMSLAISEYGACIVAIVTPDKNGKMADVVLGFDSAADYEKQKGTYMGATVGRYANRIRGGKFMLNGQPVILNCNDGKNHLHGGNCGFDRKLWCGKVIDERSVAFTYESCDGEENYPGNLRICVKYTLSDANSINIDYNAVSDKDTVVNLTNHSYFNLKGHEKGGADKQILRINADMFTGIDSEVIPDGTVMPVECTPMDFRNYAVISSRMDFPYIQLRNGAGYDHNWVLNKRERSTLSLAAELYDAESGRFMTLHTTKPGIQFYSGQFLDGSMTGKGGAIYMKHGGICLEPQYFPNAMEQTHFPTPILRKGEEYHHVTRFTFTVKELDPKCYS